MRRATAGQRFLDARSVLARIDEDQAGAWRREEASVIDRLALLELRSVGLRPPPDLLARMPRPSV